VRLVPRLSEDSKMIYHIDRDCALIGNPRDLRKLRSLEKPILQPEGIIVDDQLNLHIVSEPGDLPKRAPKKSWFYKLGES
jgi:uncharacterized protein YjiK